MSGGIAFSQVAYIGIAGLYLYNRLGMSGDHVVTLCPHEFKTVQISKGLFTDSYSYLPNDCDLRVRGRSCRPLIVRESDERCFGFGDECMGKFH